MEQIEIDYKNYNNLLKKMAGKYCKVPGLNYEDVKSEIDLIFVKACQNYNPAKGAKPSCIQGYINREMINYVQASIIKESQLPDYYDQPSSLPAADEQYEYLESIENASLEVKELISLVFDNPLIGDTMRSIRKFLRKKGWKHIMIDIAIKETKQLIRSW